MKRLRDVQQDAAREQRKAQRFIERHGVGNLPGQRSETGESSGRQMVGHSSNPTALGGETDLPRKHRDDVSYSGFDSVDAFEQWLIEENVTYLPLVGGPSYPTVESLEKRARMNHVFSFMDPARVELLRWKFVEGMTLEAIAEQEAVSKQAISKRLKVARAEFLTAFAEHWNDDTPWEV